MQAGGDVIAFYQLIEPGDVANGDVPAGDALVAAFDDDHEAERPRCMEFEFFRSEVINPALADISR